MPKYVNVEMDKFAPWATAPLVIEADTAEVKDHELVVKLGDAIVARVPERSVLRWWIKDRPR